jgi:hypothetical protein
VDVTLWRDSNTKPKVSGSVTVDVDVGVVNIGNKAYVPYIRKSGSWVAYGAYKGNGASFDMLS